MLPLIPGALAACLFVLSSRHSAGLHLREGAIGAQPAEGLSFLRPVRNAKRVAKEVARVGNEIVEWVLAEPGQSCDEACATSNGTSGGPPDVQRNSSTFSGCSELALRLLDRSEELVAVALQLEVACDESGGFGHSEFPQMLLDGGRCYFRRAREYVPTCADVTYPPAERFCACSQAGAAPGRVEWYVGSPGESCDQACAHHSALCNESAIEGVDSPEEVVALAARLNHRCDLEAGLTAREFPSRSCGDRCSYTWGYQATCHLRTSGDESRFCPCLIEGHAGGDPHLTNIHGEPFDVMRGGISNLLLFPRREGGEWSREAQLRVDASIEHPGNGTRCRDWYILQIFVSGSLLGETVSVSTRGYDLAGPGALAIKVGSTVMRNASDVDGFLKGSRHSFTLSDRRPGLAPRHAHNRINFATLDIHLAGVLLEVKWFTGKKIANNLDLRASRLGKLGREWGGLLGDDDHSWEVTYDPNCPKSPDYGRLADGSAGDGLAALAAAGGQGSWSARASLD